MEKRIIMVDKITIKFPDGNSKKVTVGTTGFEIAGQISQSLSKEAIAIEANGKILDLSSSIEEDSDIKILKRNDDQALEIIRHDCAHVMAEAVQTCIRHRGEVETHPWADQGRRSTFENRGQHGD